MNSVALAFLIGHTLFLALFVIFSFINYKNRFRSSYDLRNHFPYELNYESHFNDNFVGNVAMVISSICGVCFYIFFDQAHLNGYYMFVMIIGAINVIFSSSLIFIPLKTLKMHLIIITINIVLSFLIPFGIALNASIYYASSKEATNLVFAIMGAIYCLFIFILVMNPKLNKWAKLEEVKSPDGAISYVRPKYFVLAFTEWLLMFFMILSELLVFLSYTLIK